MSLKSTMHLLHLFRTKESDSINIPGFNPVLLPSFPPSSSFAEYIVEAFTVECAPPDVILKVVGFTTVAVVTLVNCLSVKLATTIQNVFCFCKLLAIGIIICGGLYKIVFDGSYENIISDPGSARPREGRTGVPGQRKNITAIVF